MLLRFRQRLLLDHSAVTSSVAVDVVDLQTNRRFVVVVVLPLADINEVLGKSGSQLDVRMSANGFIYFRGPKTFGFCTFCISEKNYHNKLRNEKMLY